MLSTVAPGALILYHYKHADVETLGTIKLVILSAALTLPILLANALVAIGVSREGAYIRRHFVAAMLCTFIAFYFALMVAWWFALPFRSFLVALLISQLLVLIFEVSWAKRL